MTVTMTGTFTISFENKLPFNHLRAKPAAGSADTSQNPVRGLYFGEFITVSDLTLTCLGLKP